VVASFFSYGGCSGLLAFKKENGRGVFLCVIVHMEIVELRLQWNLLGQALCSGLASLWKLVITVYLSSGICECPTYILTL
jgi:hypothetical protein